MSYPTYLVHFNPNHDKLGRFTFKTTFISGSSKTTNPDSPYYRKELPKSVRNDIDRYMRTGDRILVGDAPGVDRQVQDYLKSKNYKNVEVYGPGKGDVRYSADKDWKTKTIDSGKYEPDTDEWRAEKDKVMSELADRGLAIVLENGGAGATRDNVNRLLQQHKDVKMYELDSDGGISKIDTSILKKSMDRAMSAAKTKADVDSIVSTFNKKERDLFGLKDDNEEYLSVEQGEYVLKRILLKHGNTPIAFFDMLDDGDTVNIALGTRSGEDYRGKGYATTVAQKGLDWYEKHKSEFENKTLVWAPKRSNEASIKIAEKMGFEKDPSSEKEDSEWVSYLKKYN